MTTKIPDLFKIVCTMPYVGIAYLFINSLHVMSPITFVTPRKETKEILRCLHAGANKSGPFNIIPQSEDKEHL